MQRPFRRRFPPRGGRLPLGLAALLIAAQASFAGAAAGLCSSSYITDEARGEETIDRYGANFQSVNVFAFELNGECRVVAKSPWVEEASRRLKDDPRRLILIDVVNEVRSTPGPCRDLSPGAAVHRLLSDPVRRAAHIRELVAIGALGQGVEIDYEHVLEETTPFFTRFMGELRAALPPEKKLAAVVQPKTQGGGEQGKTIDWRGIEPFVDYIRVMAYYYSWNTSPPGPSLPYAKLDALADHILHSPTQSIPAAKARILLSLYGWDWPVSPRSPGRLIGYAEAMSLARNAGVQPQRDAAEDTLRFQYRDGGGTLHEVWFDDAEGHRKRVQRLMDRGFPAIDLWHLNTGDPALWRWFNPQVRSDCDSLAASPGPPPAAVLTGLSVSAVGRAGGDVPLTLYGAGFSASDVVLWGGNPYFPDQAGPDSLRVVIPASELAKPRVHRVSVAQGGRLSNALDFYVVGNPLLGSFDPPAASAGGVGFTLTLRGGGFEPGSGVLWDGRTVPTRFVGEKELRADIDAALIDRPASVRVGVVNPSSGSRISRFFPVSPPRAGPAAADDQTRVFPNPWAADRHGGSPITFDNLPRDATVTLFTPSARRIKSLAVNRGSAAWDMTDDAGEPVPSGYYIYFISDARGREVKGKAAVIK